MTKIPLLCVADASPDDCAASWIVHTRGPLLLARFDPLGVLSWRLHCWPAEIESEWEAERVLKKLQTLANFYAVEVEELEGLPSSWSYVFDANEAPPDFMVCDNYRSNFTGILRMKEPRMWLLPHKDAAEELWRIEPITPGADGDQQAISEAWDWWLDYCAAEDVLHE